MVRPMSSTIRPTTKSEELKGTRPASEDGFDVALGSTVQDDAKLQPDNTQHLTRVGDPFFFGSYTLLTLTRDGDSIICCSVSAQFLLSTLQTNDHMLSGSLYVAYEFIAVG